jgi:ATP synthase protein I
MAARDSNDSHRRSSEEAALSARLKHLRDELDQHRPRRSEEPASGQQTSFNASGFARGMRLSSELIAGVLVGAAIGWAIDKWLGISPWGMIVFLMLGFAAGVLNVMRSAGVAPGGPNQ